jgi:hypothetical protein
VPRITKWNANGISDAALRVTERRMGQAVTLVQREIKVSLNVGNRTGENPSSPGEPPRKVSGRLFNSIFAKVLRNGSQVIGVVGTNVKYARRLELGFVGKDALGRVFRQLPRPFIRPAFLRLRDHIKRILGAK